MLTLTHFVYVFFTALLIAAVVRGKDFTLIGLVGIVAVALFYTRNPGTALSTVCKAVYTGFSDIMPVFFAISLIMALTYVLKDADIDMAITRLLRISPGHRSRAFVMAGLLMTAVSFFIWPSPAVVLLGVFMVPIAQKAGLEAVWLASAMNIFGHGVVLSGDFLIQGVPGITASGAGMQASELFPYLVPLWFVMSIVTVSMSFFFMRRDGKKQIPQGYGSILEKNPEKRGGLGQISRGKKTACLIILTIVAVFDVTEVFFLGVSGDDATNLIAGTAFVACCIITVIIHQRKKAARAAMSYFVDGCVFTMRVFAPAFLIIAFFELGNKETAQMILGEGANGLLGDVVAAIADSFRGGVVFSTIMQFIVSIIYSLDGSGIAGLTVIGDIASSYPISLEQVKILTSFGQIVIMWVAGGTLIPWGLLPVSSVCGVSPTALARNNFKPVCCGLLVLTISTAVMMVMV